MQREPPNAREAASSTAHQRKPSSLANIAVQSFAAFRSQTSSIPAPSPVRRKPLPANASPVTGRYSSAEFNTSPTLVGDKAFIQRSYSIDSLPPQGPRRLETILSPPQTGTELDFAPRDLDAFPHGATPLMPQVPDNPVKPQALPSYIPLKPPSTSPPRPQLGRSASYDTARKQRGGPSSHVRTPTMPNMPMYSADPRQQLTLQLEGVTDGFLEDDPYSPDPDSAVSAKGSKSPGAIASFFGWKSSGQNGDESPTTISDKSVSPAQSPMPHRTRSKPTGLNIPVANNLNQPSYFNVPGTPLLSNSPQMNAHVEELERELREVSSELAASIRRELELEDEVERWKAESSALSIDGNRRTSDYYSDSGASSVRYPIGDSESKLEQVEMLRRKAEQERAQLKVHMAERLQEELRRRRDLEEQVQTLEEHIQEAPSRNNSFDGSSERVRDLENSLEDVKRRLVEERQMKENFEDLLTALRQDLEQHRNERDNLRDEVVPQLRARLEGLETEAAETQKLIYDSTRMQQEIQNLKNENQTLINARRMQADLAQQQTRFQSIAEEGDAAPSSGASPRIGLSRSNSLARNAAFNPKRGSLSRSNSVKDRSAPESPRNSMHANPTKEIEEQRDALHRALRNLLQRQEHQANEYQKRIKQLEIERDNALNLTPRRTTFHTEVSNLRDEVNHLRRRADDALEQKWQCEKGLGGLRMDLDRAQQETSSLRDLLKEHDITIPEIHIDGVPHSPSLDKAYNELRTTHALSLARIREMESEDTLGAAGAEAQRVMELLKQSISDAEAERDMAQSEAEQYRQQARALQKAEIEHLGKEQTLSTELYAAATRMDELSTKVHQQLLSNKSLRAKLADAIARGEKEQQKSTDQIVELERKLKAAEDKVMSAQQTSEEAISKHEDEIQALKESQKDHQGRVKPAPLLFAGKLSPNGPRSPVFALRSPRLDQTSSGPGMSIAEATRTEALEKRVLELEKALTDADHEMEEVVGRMNMAQIEVADLQYQKDEAMRDTRKLQSDILAEREKVKALMARN